MEPSSQPQPVMGVVTGASEAYPPGAAYPPQAMVLGAPAAVPPGSQPSAPFPTNPAQPSAQHQLVYQQAQQFHQQLQQQQQQQLREFWANQVEEIEQATDFKNHSLPLARIKKIMKADEDVRMISAEAPVVFAKACEVFILELTLRSWMHTEENKRRTLQKNDIAAAITRTDIYDFLVDIVPRDEMKEEGLGLPRVGLPPNMGPAADTYPYYYVPAQQGPGSGMMYGGQQGHPVTYVWQQPQEQQEEPPEEQQQSLLEGIMPSQFGSHQSRLMCKASGLLLLRKQMVCFLCVGSYLCVKDNCQSKFWSKLGTSTVESISIYCIIFGRCFIKLSNSGCLFIKVYPLQDKLIQVPSFSLENVTSQLKTSTFLWDTHVSGYKAQASTQQNI